MTTKPISNKSTQNGKNGKNGKNGSISPLNNSILQTLNNNNSTINDSNHVTHHNITTNIFDPKTHDTKLSKCTNKQITPNQMTPSNCTVYQVNELMNIISQLQEQVKNQDKIIQDQYDEICKKDNKIIQKDKEIKRCKSAINSERSKKRDLVTFLCEHGFYNQTIGRSMGTFEYSAEIRKYRLENITRFVIGQLIYYIGEQSEDIKTFHYTNSGNITLHLSQLAVVSIEDPSRVRRCKNITSISAMFENDDCSDGKFSDVIRPGGHFSVTFRHPVEQRLGTHELFYRLYSHKKANTRKFNRRHENGAFGQTIKFTYQVRARS